MAIADGSQHSLHYILESTYGTTPATPTWTPLPHTGTTLGMEKEGIEGGKIRGDRHVVDFRHGTKSISGDVTAELAYNDFDDLLEAALGGTWATNVLKVGSTRRSYTIERKFADIATPEWHRHTGCEVASMSLSVAPNSMITTTFSFVGQNMSLNTAEVASSTYTADDNDEPMDAFSGTVTEGGVSSAVITQIDLTLENGIEPRFAVGSDLTIEPSMGRSRATGSMTLYYESKTMYEKFINETESDIVFTLLDPSGNELEFDLARVKYNSGKPDVTGEGSVTISMDFVVLYSAGDLSSIVITRTP